MLVSEKCSFGFYDLYSLTHFLLPDTGTLNLAKFKCLSQLIFFFMSQVRTKSKQWGRSSKILVAFERVRKSILRFSRMRED